MNQHLENWNVEPPKLAEIGFAAYRKSCSIDCSLLAKQTLGFLNKKYSLK